MQTQPLNIPTKLLIAIALVQGLILLLLHQSIEFKFWPYQSPQWLFSFYSIALVGPLLLLLSLNQNNTKAILKWAVPFTLIAGLTGYYVGYQKTPLPHLHSGDLLAIYVMTMTVATFKALMYTQQFSVSKQVNYSQLFRWSWRNFLTLALALLFTLCFWGVLMLWAGLFKAIKINLFYDLFTESWFYYPALSLAHGMGIVLFRRQFSIIDTIARIQQTLMKFLLVVLIFISMLFLSTLPFTGLDVLWQSGGSSLILWMQALILFAVNAVYQDDPDTHPYPVWLHRYIYAGIALLPIYSLISFYGLSLRVEQYGWSIARCWAFLLWGLLALFAAGYLLGIIRHRDRWLDQLSWVNVRMGIVLLVTLLMINSPLVDFRKISVNSQLARLESNEVSLKEFDLSYFRYNLERPGYEALMALKKEIAESDPDIALNITRLYRNFNDDEVSFSKEEFAKAVHVVNGTAPDDLMEALYQHVKSQRLWGRYTPKYSIYPIDLDENGELEYLFVQNSYSVFFTLYYLEGSRWKSQSMQFTKGKGTGKPELLLEKLKSNDFELEKPKWRNIKAEGMTLKMQ
ncbi:DUF4153 domain-containing protein [Pleionea sp. CnH1-48]|uniref:DUF4153 domain-containing protein n=1 Tax=Pleionea sp. CnH1-48 TaxID=2954494 RepID=UPI002096F2F2|nr:DUF4153 domain-containing protein [Pleionea sp. CnH1-48]MCO7223363.1 DUF4153 domain-containing protein [Pleionea sp. CnH1-48]